ncbi:MAG: Hsp70 family protein [Myxococcales bacterium]|nr:Hsp70 family protein [Myxococcales bacterium]
MAWALDLGTTNTGLARWEDAEARPRLVELERICRLPGEQDYLHAPRLVPSATHILGEADLARRLHRLPFFRNSLTLGRYARIGREAIEASEGHDHPHFVPHFKGHLARSPIRPIARCPERAYAARDVAWMFLRELFGEVKRQTGERLRELVVTVPVDSYEVYRTELRNLLERLGVERVRFVDEPVAAAFGYGIGLSHQRVSLVVDFGGGTLDMALVRFEAGEAVKGQCTVLAKAGRAVGGNLVDRWLLEALCERAGIALAAQEQRARDDHDAWLPLMLAEARRVKEAVFFERSASFNIVPPDERWEFDARLAGREPESTVELSKAQLHTLLEERGLYTALSECLLELDQAAHQRDCSFADVQDVLMVGGSTLLPGVFPLFEERFGRDRVRAWQPFEAVAYGAAALAADRITGSDHIVHDYAIRTRDAANGEHRYNVVVPRGTRFPTAEPLWKRQLVPTCARGEAESYFKLVVCEIGRAHDEDPLFAWDERGKLHRLGGDHGSDALVVPLNADNPTLGTLAPPHQPGDTSPRLEVSFGINADRWLTANVYDLQTKRFLMEGETVVRLL